MYIIGRLIFMSYGFLIYEVFLFFMLWILYYFIIVIESILFIYYEFWYFKRILFCEKGEINKI